MSEKIWVVIPAFNEESIIQDVLQEIQHAGYTNIIVVDDGSSDETQKKATSLKGVVAVKHLINRGKGAAIKTGIEAAKKLGADIVITLDGDGQHNPADIKPMLGLIHHDGYDVVLGSRLKNTSGMPYYKICHNYIGNFFVWMLYGRFVTDSQSGFRAYSKKAIDTIDTKSDRYEYDSEVIREIHYHKLRFTEIPIEVRYTPYSMGKTHKMTLQNGIKTLFKMFFSS